MLSIERSAESITRYLHNNSIDTESHGSSMTDLESQATSGRSQLSGVGVTVPTGSETVSGSAGSAIQVLPSTRSAVIDHGPINHRPVPPAPILPAHSGPPTAATGASHALTSTGSRIHGPMHRAPLLPAPSYGSPSTAVVGANALNAPHAWSYSGGYS